MEICNLSNLKCSINEPNDENIDPNQSNCGPIIAISDEILKGIDFQVVI